MFKNKRSGDEKFYLDNDIWKTNYFFLSKTTVQYVALQN